MEIGRTVTIFELIFDLFRVTGRTQDFRTSHFLESQCFYFFIETLTRNSQTPKKFGSQTELRNPKSKFPNFEISQISVSLEKSQLETPKSPQPRKSSVHEYRPFPQTELRNPYPQ